MLMQDRPHIILDEAESQIDMETVIPQHKLSHIELANKIIICVTHENIQSDLFDMIINNSLVTLH